MFAFDEKFTLLALTWGKVNISNPVKFSSVAAACLDALQFIKFVAEQGHYSKASFPHSTICKIDFRHWISSEFIRSVRPKKQELLIELVYWTFFNHFWSTRFDWENDT